MIESLRFIGYVVITVVAAIATLGVALAALFYAVGIAYHAWQFLKEKIKEWIK